MGLASQVQWSGLGFTPFSSPELPVSDANQHKGSFITEWATGITEEESRQYSRESVQYEVLITDPNWWETENPLPIRGECLNVSENGLYAVVPIGYGLAIGQRYLFHWRCPGGAAGRSSQFGTIVRTEVLLGYEQDRLGIGVRLVGPTD